MSPIYYAGSLSGPEQESYVESFLVGVFDEYLELLQNSGEVEVKIGVKTPGALDSAVSLGRIYFSGEDTYDILSDSGQVLFTGALVGGLTSAAMLALTGGIVFTGAAAIGAIVTSVALGAIVTELYNVTLEPLVEDTFDYLFGTTESPI